MQRIQFSRLFKVFIPALSFALIGWGGMRPSSPTAQTSDTFVYLPLITQQADHTWQWHAPQFLTLTPTPNASDAFLLAIDSGGLPHLWYDTYTSPRFIYHTTLTAQGWLTPTQIADTLGTSYTLFPPVRDAEGHFHLVWRNWLGSGVPDPYRLMYAQYAHGTWNPEEEVYRTDGDLQGMVSLDSSGTPHVTSAGSIFVFPIQYFSRTQTAWSAPTTISVSHPVYWVWPDVLGGVQLYGESYNTAFYHTSWLNDTQHTDELPYTASILGQDTQLDGENNLHVFERTQVPIPGGTVYGITHRCLTHDLLWTEAQVLSGETDTTSPLLKTEDGQGGVALAWQDSSENLVHVALFDGCTLTKTGQVLLPLDQSWQLEASALSQEPPVFCLLARKMYTSTEYLTQCSAFIP